MVAGRSGSVTLEVERYHQVGQVALEERQGGIAGDRTRAGTIEIQSDTTSDGCRCGRVRILGSGVVDGFRPAGVDGVGRAAGIGLEVLYIGQRVGGHRHAGGVDTAIDEETERGAFGGHTVIVIGVGSEAGKGIEGVCDIINGGATEHHGEAGTAVRLPAERHLVRRDIGHGHILGGVAPIVGQEDIVERAVACRRGTRAMDGDIGTVAGIVGKINYIQGGGGGKGDGVDRHKGTDRVGIVHHTDDKQRPG